MPNLGERLLIVFTSLAAAASALVILAAFAMVGNRLLTTSEAFGVQLFCCISTISIWGFFRIGLFLFAPGPGHSRTRDMALLLAFSPLIMEFALIVLGMIIYAVRG